MNPSRRQTGQSSQWMTSLPWASDGIEPGICPTPDSGLNKPAEWRNVTDPWEGHWTLQWGGEGPGHTPSPPDSSPSESTQPWTLDLDKRREAALCLVYLIWETKFWKWSAGRGFDDLQGSSWEKRRKVRCLSHFPLGVLLLPCRKCWMGQIWGRCHLGGAWWEPLPWWIHRKLPLCVTVFECRLVRSLSLPRQEEYLVRGCVQWQLWS